MRRPVYIAVKENIVDHLIAGVLSALAMFVTLMLGVLLAALQSGPSMLAVFTTVHIWGAILTTIAFVVGLVVGPSQMARLLGHLWGTELGAHRALSLSLWLGVFVVVAVTYVVSQ